MKTLAFYNEKGGVGKSTFTIMYASWLKYKFGIKVGVADYNYRIGTYRNDEIKQRKRSGTWDAFENKECWPIVTIDPVEIRNFNKGIVNKYAYWLQNNIDNGDLKDCDIILIDLPGSIAGGELADLIRTRMLSLCIIPTDRDMQTMRATLHTVNVIRKFEIPYCVFMNQVQTFVSFNEYDRMINELKTMKNPIKVLPDMISYTERMKNFFKVDIMKSTFEYPDWDSKTYEGSRDNGLDNLFIDVTRELQQVPDIKGTKECDLSFVNGLEKEFQEKRQLFGTSYGEYEFPVEMFPKRRREKEL